MWASYIKFREYTQYTHKTLNHSGAETKAQTGDPIVGRTSLCRSGYTCEYKQYRRIMESFKNTNSIREQTNKRIPEHLGRCPDAEVTQAEPVSPRENICQNLFGDGKIKITYGINYQKHYQLQKMKMMMNEKEIKIKNKKEIKREK